VTPRQPRHSSRESFKLGMTPKSQCHARETRRVKAIMGFHMVPVCSLFRGLRPRRIEEIAKNSALRDNLQNFSEFSHDLESGHPTSRFRENDTSLKNVILDDTPPRHATTVLAASLPCLPRCPFRRAGIVRITPGGVRARPAGSDGADLALVRGTRSHLARSREASGRYRHRHGVASRPQRATVASRRDRPSEGYYRRGRAEMERLRIDSSPRRHQARGRGVEGGNRRLEKFAGRPRARGRWRRLLLFHARRRLDACGSRLAIALGRRGVTLRLGRFRGL
jgi:hypothetical protein